MAKIFKERGVNVALFPEFCLSGYFWEEDEAACREYMDEAVTENHHDWIDNELRPLIDDTFFAIVLNNLTRAKGGKYFNSTFPIAEGYDYTDDDNIYNKVFLPGIEKTYTESGRDDRLMVESKRGHGKFGFTTCYDYLFNDLLREYALEDEVDAIVQVASWRAAATRDYAGMNVRTDSYYGDLWDKVMAANSAINQVWTFSCNAVGRHGVSGVPFWGGSGVWAPSGIKLDPGLPLQRGAADRAQPRHPGRPGRRARRVQLRDRLPGDLPAAGGLSGLHSRDRLATPTVTATGTDSASPRRCSLHRRSRSARIRRRSLSGWASIRAAERTLPPSSPSHRWSVLSTSCSNPSASAWAPLSPAPSSSARSSASAAKR